MLKTIFLGLCLICAMFLVSCTKTEPAANNSNTAADKPATAATTPAATKPATASAEKVGVAECDNFLAAYEACVTDKVPAAARAQYQSGLAQWRKSWKTLADNPQTKPTLVQACKQAMEQQRAAMKSYGCTF
jgi:hypothetical protein